MKALLDTRTFLWWNMDDGRLSATARQFITDGNNEIFISAASAWEIAIKAGRGSVILPLPPDEYLASRLRLHNFQPLAVQVSHALQVYHLPEIHRDPFDRLLVAQSQLENLPIITADPAICQYSIETIW